jgi:hypothetical protein
VWSENYYYTIKCLKKSTHDHLNSQQANRKRQTHMQKEKDALEKLKMDVETTS